MDVLAISQPQPASSPNNGMETHNIKTCPNVLHLQPTPTSLKHSTSTILRVLVVGSDSPHFDEIAPLVQSWGHLSWTACNSLEARQMAAARQPHVVLLSLDRRLRDEYSITRLLRHKVLIRDCLVIGLTRSITDERRHLCEQAGIDLILAHPGDADVLETILLLEKLFVNPIPESNCLLTMPSGDDT